MTKPMPLADFKRLPPLHSVAMGEGLSGAIDPVAAAGPESRRFLRYAWFAAALCAYGGNARTAVVKREGEPVLALPMTNFGPTMLRFAEVPGCYWPFRGFPARDDAGQDAYAALLAALSSEINLLRIGPVYDDDPVLARLRDAAASQRWRAIPRFIADSYMLDMAVARADGSWPRNSTLRKNRYHEKHLASHGALEWSFVGGRGWTAALFDDLAMIEEASWIAAKTDGGDAKFTRTGHGAFWRAAADDPVIADMMRAAVLRVDGKPAAFSFDLDAGRLKYAVANSYDPQYAKHSPGKLIYYRNLLQALEAGVERVDWGAGDSGYKRTIGAEKGPAIRDWLFVRPGAPALVAGLAGGLWMRSGQA
ncbi:GNAT family N-acetyltransferase [Stakelama sp. CBK3Z-3]|uniref:GNAT family N-acetyltransferase n=1 Tax=Stakelama flava TaxID=2860338 RepID=A0ABS6XNG5_9SPHN|nr:GNAT family N-acetyltransferase [Stakelama flava]MBW4331749.1 GNAT family N-acetyltransferase [Stakelama flava]